MTENKAVRRRGQALDEAILDSAWNELLEHGYSNFTLEGVAKRAGTSRPVLSRRWQSRAELAVAALNYYRSQHPISVPEFGNVREELTFLLLKISERSVPVMNTILLGMRDYFEETHSNLLNLRDRFEVFDALEEVLQRAILRGEIDPSKLTARIASLPLDLVRNEGLMINSPITREVVTEILDTIFLPLVGTSPQKAGEAGEW